MLRFTSFAAGLLACLAGASATALEPALDPAKGASVVLHGPYGAMCEFAPPFAREIRIYWRPSAAASEPRAKWKPVFRCSRTHREKRNYEGEYLITAWHRPCPECAERQSELVARTSAGEFRFRAAPADAGYSMFWLYTGGAVVHY